MVVMIHKTTLIFDSGGVHHFAEPVHVLSVGLQRGIWCVWYMVSPPSDKWVTKALEVYDTGHPMRDNGLGRRFVGTTLFHEDSLVLHVFAVDYQAPATKT
jgi:hypothetical protein